MLVYSKPVAVELTANTCPAVPRAVSPVPPFVVGTVDKEIVGFVPPEVSIGEDAEIGISLYSNPVAPELTANICPAFPTVESSVPPEEGSKGFSNILRLFSLWFFT